MIFVCFAATAAIFFVQVLENENPPLAHASSRDLYCLAPVCRTAKVKGGLKELPLKQALVQLFPTTVLFLKEQTKAVNIV